MIKTPKLTNVDAALIQGVIAHVEVFSAPLDLGTIKSVAAMADPERVIPGIAKISNAGFAIVRSSAARRSFRFGEGGHAATVNTTI